MVVVRRKLKVGVRLLGPYRWDRANNWTTEVDEDDLLEILTNPGFEVVGDDLAAIDGISDLQMEELLLRGISTFEKLMEATPAKVAKGWRGVGVKTVRDWQGAARDITQAEEALDNG